MPVCEAILSGEALTTVALPCPSISLLVLLWGPAALPTSSLLTLMIERDRPARPPESPPLAPLRWLE